MLISYLVTLAGYLALTLAFCYAPDGTLSPGDGYLPCVYTLNVHSMCCVLNVTALERIGETAANADTCLTSGLCLNGMDYSRAYCTDPTWKSPNCLNVCTGGSVSLNNPDLSIPEIHVFLDSKLTTQLLIERR